MRHRTGRSVDRPASALVDASLDEVARLAAAGDRGAQQAFVDRTMADVWRFCSHLVGPSLADDATQATYLRALRSLGSFRGESSPKTWLLGVARHVCLDELRSQGRHDRIERRLAHQPSDAHAPGPSVPPELTALLLDLDPDRREAFVLTQVLGFSYEEAAEVAGCAVGTVRSRVARARMALVDDLLAGEARPTGRPRTTTG